MVKIFKNIHLKILALITAILLWFFVVGVDNTVSVFPETLNVEVNNIAKNISIASVIPQVKIYIKGDKEVIKNLTKNDFSAYVDVSDKGVGEYQAPILVNAKNSQVVVVKVEPSQVAIKLAPQAEKDVDVKISVKGQPKTGYKVQDFQTDTTKVKISGAQTILDNISAVTAELILDGTETADISRKVTLSVPEMKNFPENSLEINPIEVQVTVTIAPEVIEKEVDIKPNFKTTQDQNLWEQKVLLNPNKIKIKGEADKLKDIESVSTEYINVSALSNSSTPFAIGLVLPENITLSDPQQKVMLSATKEATDQKAFNPSIHFTSSYGLKLKTASTYNLSVMVKGAASVLKKLKKEDISVNVNLDRAGSSGSIAILPEDIKVPEGFEIVSFEPDQLQIELGE